jgi:hypothetical protein
MPLLDHFRPPLFPRRSYESFHSMWAGQLAGQFNTRPTRYGFLAELNIHVGITVAADVVAFEEGSQPLLAVPVDLAGLEVFEIRVYDEERARTLVAAVELVGPANKDRQDHRRAFLDKCAAYLREGVSVIVVDIVTSRQYNFHAALMELFSGGEAAARAVTSDLYAVAYRVRPVGTRTQLEAWPHALALGAPLPTLPLWLTESLSVPLDLEAGYRETCRSAAIG